MAESLVGVSADSDWPPDVVQRVPVLDTVAIATRTMSSREIDAAAQRLPAAGRAPRAGAPLETRLYGRDGQRYVVDAHLNRGPGATLLDRGWSTDEHAERYADLLGSTLIEPSRENTVR